ncbi:aldehyde dehydrogenase family protein [Hymenobacter roseosalivarius DSM 11622]|uniref:Aldehyde dehydrogenase family protein n=1 Tax=Hymenobacter roseosalivarius DSM 11622 TaxID=645990 RepID=A0A1W1VZ43_9BACT|nr:aldehyde dehydrogenase family protein [Hymenobacter roseosalivarius]SMB98652.1 aldehyde dehydrogenase family protein [Hymenobacter roseosalivarius DSM 11622]
MPKIISPQVEFSYLLSQVQRVTPEILTPDGQFLNLMEGRWQEPGQPRNFTSPVDGTSLGALPMLGHETGLRAVIFAKQEAAAWAATDLDERKSRVQNCLNQLREQVDLVGKLLIWEIGKTYKLGFTDIIRLLKACNGTWIISRGCWASASPWVW